MNQNNITWLLYYLGDAYARSLGDTTSTTAWIGQYVGEQDGKPVTVSAVGPVDSDFHLQHHVESLKGKGFDVTLETLKNAEIRLAASLAGLPDAQRRLHDVQRRLHGAWQAHQRNSNLRPGA